MLGPRSIVSADHGSIAVGGDIHGILPDQLKAVLVAALAESNAPLASLNAQQAATIAALERRLGATQEQVLGFFRILGEAGIQPDAIPARLLEIAARHRDLLAQAAATPDDSPETATLRARLRLALEQADLDRADALLADILALEERDIDRRAVQAAATSAQRAELAMTRLRYPDAARHYAAAAARLPLADETARIEYLFLHAEAWYRQGDEFGDAAAVATSREASAVLLPLCPREPLPLHWAAVQNGLGVTLTLAGHRGDTTAVHLAISTFEAALLERTRERFPLA